MEHKDGNEIHHIVPVAEGGADDDSNLVSLDVRNHYMAHRLLSRIWPNQIFAVVAILERHRNLKYSRYVRRMATVTRAAAMRQRNRDKVRNYRYAPCHLQL